MKVGFMQLAPVLGSVDRTIRKIDDLLEDVRGVDILVLPELCNSGYNFESRNQAWETSESTNKSVFISYVESVCRRHQLHVVTGFNEREGSSLYNSAVLVGPDGYLGKYRKLHLYLNERDHFTPGDVGLPVFDIGSCRIGMLICFDWLFPEIWRVLALKDIDLICHPSNLVNPGRAHKAVVAHALCNRIHIVTANRTGSEGDLTFGGCSTVIVPSGEVLVQASPSKEEVKSVSINTSLSRDKMITSRNHVLTDRRPEEYGLVAEIRH